MLQSQASNIPGGLGAGVAPEWRSDERETLRQGRRSRTSRTGQPPSFFGAVIANRVRSHSTAMISAYVF
jgi:hypothetical protein